MITIIAGSREGVTAAHVQAAIRESGFHITEVVCGMADGADAHGFDWAMANGIPVRECPADWTRHGKAAGPIRNSEMAVKAEALIAVRAGGASSRGTTDMIAKATRRGLKIHIHDV